MMTGFNLLFVLYVVFLAVASIAAIVLAVLLCRFLIAARENQLVTARLRELQIEQMLMDAGPTPPEGPAAV